MNTVLESISDFPLERNISVLDHFGVPFCGLLVFYFIYIHIFLYILLVKTHIIYKKNLKIISLYITINISILSLNIYPIIIIITINTFLEYKNINMNFFRDKYELFFIKYKYRSTSRVLSNYRSLRFCSFSFFFFLLPAIYIYIYIYKSFDYNLTQYLFIEDEFW